MLGRFAQADTIVPVGVQGYDRYAYVNNNPVRYTDPSGHAAWQGDDGGLGDDEGSDETSTLAEDDPITWDTGDVIIIVMPPGSNPTMPRPNLAKRLGTGLGIAGFLFDVGEIVGIFIPQIGGEDLAAFADVGVTYASSLLSGQSYFMEKPHPDIPRTVSVNQDVLFTTGDAVTAAAAKAVFGLLGGPAGVVAGKGVDVVTTGASLAYDYSRVFGSTPNYITVGISVNFDETFGNAVIMIWQQP